MKRERKVPRRRFREFQNEGTWKSNKFKDVFDLLKNNTVSRADLNYEKGSVKNVHYGDVLIKFGDYIDVSKTKLPYFNCDKIVQRFASSLLQDGDIVIADTAEDATVGKCTEIQGSAGIKLVSGLHTIPCRPKVKFAPKYLGYYINSYSYHNQLIPLMQGTKVTSISKSAIQETDMLIPKLIDEEHKIGEYFSNIDNLITLNQRKLEKLKALKQAYLTQMFPSVGECKPKLRFAGFNDEWDNKKFEDIFKLSQGLQIEISKRFTEPGENRYFYITNEFLKDSCEEEYYIESPSANVICDKDDILMTRTGNTGIVVTDVEGCFHNNFFKIQYNKKSYSKKYICYFLTSTYMQKTILNSAGSSTIPDLSHKAFYKICGYFPSVEEQEKIGEHFSKLDNLINIHKNKLEKLQNLKKAYLNEMFI